MIRSDATSRTRGFFNYPKLMVSASGNIVLMVKEREGLLVAKNPDGMVDFEPEYRTDWTMDAFFEYNGKVTLRNSND